MFEFDPAKSEGNRRKHGIDFVEAQALWDDEGGIEAATTFATETRFIRIALAKRKLWFAVFTLRDDRIRIISVRRARRKEQEAYEEQQSKG